MKKKGNEVENNMNQSVNNNLKYQELLILAYFKANYKKYEFNDIAQIMGMTYVEMRECIEHLLELNYLLLTRVLYYQKMLRNCWKNKNSLISSIKEEKMFVKKND